MPQVLVPGSWHNVTGGQARVELAADTLGGTASQMYTVVINPPNVITTTTLPNWTQGVPFNQTIQHTGGTGPSYTFSVSMGALPTGLMLNPGTGQITGTPTSAFNSFFTVTASGSNGVVSKIFSLLISGNTPGPLGISNAAALPAAGANGEGRLEITR